MDAFVARYLAGEQTRVQAQHISAGRYTAKRNNLRDFRDWFGQTTSIEAISGDRLLEYKNDLLARVAENKLARDTAHDRLGDALSFVRWLWEIEALAELPRILLQKSQKLVIGKKLPNPQFFSVEEVKRCLEMAVDRTRLYLLLMLNAGMYQSDISDLRQDEVDWRVGTITRKRSKTKAHAGVPTVRYKLWPQTFELLKAHCAKHGELALLNRNGSPLVVRGSSPTATQ